MLEKTDHPLVSIIVITYNSGKFVTGTLESARKQTYPNVELIVSDDRSTDDTVDICRGWIDENRDRFVRVTLVTTEKNTGVPANINRGVSVSQGQWIKCIAGDDLLSEDCISELIGYISAQPDDIQILSSDVIRFTGESVSDGVIEKNRDTRFFSPESTAKDQYEMLLRFNRIFAASVILRRDLLLSVNGFDERFRLLEDWPLWIKITETGHKIYYLNKALVYYRLHDTNISMTKDENYIYHPVLKAVMSFKEKELLHRLPFIERWGWKHDMLAIKTCFFLGNNKQNLIARLAYFIFNVSNPFYNYLRITKIFGIKYSKLEYIDF